MIVSVLFLDFRSTINMLDRLVHTMLSLPGEFWGAFLGAFFAFCFFLISSLFKAIFDRKRSYHNSLIQVQLEVASTIESILWNLEELSRFKESVSVSLSQKKVIPYIFQPRYVSISIDVVRGIGSNELLNQAISFFTQIETANMSLKSAKESSVFIRDLYFHEKSFDESYMLSLSKNLSYQIDSFNKGKEMAGKLLAQTRCELAFQKFWPFMNSISLSKVSEQDRIKVYERELKEVETELTKMSKEPVE